MHVAVRTAQPDDLPALEEMWDELRQTGGRWGRAMSEADLRSEFTRLQQQPGVRLLVAVIDDEPVGMAYLVHQPLVPLQSAESVHIGYLHVRPEHRRRGIGRSLVAAVLDVADAIGAKDVSVAVDPTLREANRFFARLGLRPLMMHRSSSTSVLRRRLAADEFRGDVAQDLRERRKRFLTRSRIRAVMVRLAERESGPASGVTG